MIAILWRYQVGDEHRAVFEAAYGPSGAWAELFGRSDGFRGTRLLRGAESSYLTIDLWRDREDFDAFLAEHGADYRALDERTEGWTISEDRLGEYALLD